MKSLNKKFLLLAVLSLISYAHADVNLVQICKTPKTGTSVCAANDVRWIIPLAASSVLADTWKPFSAVTNTELLTVCAANLPPNSITCPSIARVAKCSVACASCAVVNITGTLKLTWTKPDFNTGNAIPEAQLTGYRIYSGVQGSMLTLLKAVPVLPLTYDATGYGNGVYSFSISAVYGAAESTQTGPMSVEVKIPDSGVPLEPGKPSSLSITSVTLSTP